MTKKYRLTSETKNGLYRIQALRDIPYHGVTSGDLGGWVEGEHNLSQNGDAWVFGDAMVYENALVYGNAIVFGNAQVFGNARVSNYARVFGAAWVSGNATVYGNAQVYGAVVVYGNAQVFGNAKIFDNVQVSGKVWVYGNARVFGNAQITFGNITKDNQVVTFFLQYPITVTPYEIRIGCKTKPRKGKDTWDKVTLKQTMEMGLEKENYKEIRRVLNLLTKLVKKSKT